MSDITDFYQQQAASSVSNIPWLATLQTEALTHFQQMGFPTRKDEEWKYTSMDGFLKHRFVSGHTRQTSSDANRFSGRPENALPIDCIDVSIVNGEVSGTDSLTARLPSGVLVLPIAEALLTHPEKVKPWLGQVLQQDHAFHALNTAMLHRGLLIYLPAGVTVVEPLLLSHWQDKGEHATYLRHLIIAEEGSCATIIEDYQGAASADYFTSTITEVHAAANTKLTHYKLQRESKSAFHIGHLAVNQAAGSQFDSHLFSFGGQLVRSDITFNLQERLARCSMNGVYAPGEGQHMDHHTQVLHAVAECNSAQDYKGILSGHSRAVFNGKVVVAKDAQHTEAKQQNKNLLLSLNAEIDTKPQLEIFADDVTCTHGATVGQLDEDALFYLATRGIEYSEASHYLIQAFAAENLRTVPDTHLATWLSGLLNKQIGTL